MRNLTKSISQTSLFYDVPLVKSITNRSIDKNEMLLVVCTQKAIWDYIQNNPKPSSLKLSINLSAISNARNIRIGRLREIAENAVESLSMNPLSQKILAYKDGITKTVGTFTMYKFLHLDDNNVLWADINEYYLDYYKEVVLKSPIKEWHNLLGGDANADSIMDRLVQNAIHVYTGETNMRNILSPHPLRQEENP